MAAKEPMVEQGRSDLAVGRQCQFALNQPIYVLCAAAKRERCQPDHHGGYRSAVSRHVILRSPSDDLARGFLYLVAIMDWWSRKVLAWCLSNTIKVAFCVDALQEAMDRYGKLDIFNTDQRSQFTSWDFTQQLKAAGIRVSMDGMGRWLDNVFVERLWRSLKYECVYLHAWTGGHEARDGISSWMMFYNQQRPHAAHDGKTPDATCQEGCIE